MKKKIFTICSFQNASKDSRTLKSKVEKDSRTNIKENTIYRVDQCWKAVLQLNVLRKPTILKVLYAWRQKIKMPD